MHSKWDNLGYVKDQKREIFRGLCSLDLHQGSALDLQGVAQSTPPNPPQPPPHPPSSKVLPAYLFFSGLMLRVWWHVW